MEETQSSMKKTLLFPLFILLLLVVILALVSILIFKPKIPGIKSEVKPQLVAQNSLIKQTQETHSQLYFAEIEVNLDSNQVTLLGRGRLRGDLPGLLPSPPTSNSAELVYRLNVSSEKNSTLYQGYLRLPKNILAIKNSIFSIRIYSPDVPKAVIRLYDLSDRLLWSHKIQ